VVEQEEQLTGGGGAAHEEDQEEHQHQVWPPPLALSIFLFPSPSSLLFSPVRAFPPLSPSPLPESRILATKEIQTERN
jgi:hypothetical protein